MLFGQEFNPVGSLVGDQVRPAVAINANGGVLVWQDNSVTPLGSRIRAALLNGSLTAVGAPFPVSSAVRSKTAGDQEKPQVALLNDGGAVIVWQGGKLGLQQIFARFLHADGSFATSDIRVSKFTKNNQVNAAVATLADGSVMVVWSSYGQDGSRQGVFAQHFSATGGKLGGEFQVNQYTLNNQRTPAIAALSNGTYIVTWVSEGQPPRPITSVDIYARVFNATGAAIGPEFVVNVTTNICANPAVAASPAGGFAVVWSQKDAVPLAFGSANGIPISGVQTTRSTNSWDIFGRVFDEAGVGAPSQFRLNTYTYGDQYAPEVSAAGTAYLAVWTSLLQDGSWEGVFGQEFGTDGSFIGSERQVNVTTLSRQIQPTVTSDGATAFLVVWSSFVVGGNYDFDLFAREYLP